VIEREFQDAEGTKAVRSSHGYFGLVVQPVDASMTPLENCFLALK
jgi:hypothetical protein